MAYRDLDNGKTLPFQMSLEVYLPRGQKVHKCCGNTMPVLNWFSITVRVRT